MTRDKWYAAGLPFECTQCGDCCSGPDEGVIWVTKPEIRMIGDYLDIDETDLRSRYLRRIGTRTTIIEAPITRDCIFLETTSKGKICRIYPVRPNQCRTWPFWTENLRSPTSWNETAQDCPGINRGPCFSFKEIEQIRTQKKWWERKGG